MLAKLILSHLDFQEAFLQDLLLFNVVSVYKQSSNVFVSVDAKVHRQNIIDCSRVL